MGDFSWALQHCRTPPCVGECSCARRALRLYSVGCRQPRGLIGALRAKELPWLLCSGALVYYCTVSRCVVRCWIGTATETSSASRKWRFPSLCDRTAASQRIHSQKVRC